MRTKIISIFSSIVIAVVGCTSEKGEVPKPLQELTPCQQVSYAQHIAPVMAENCVSCHGPSFAGYDLSTYQGVKNKVDNGSFRNRVLIIKDMPGYCQLPDSVIQNISCWLDNGAPN